MGRLLIFALGLVIYCSSHIYGQYCNAGNLFLGDAEQSILLEKELIFSISYQNNYSNQYFKEDKVFNGFTNLKNASANYTEFRSDYGFTSKISASVELGYFFNKTINYENISYKGYGLGDVATYLNYKLYHNKTAKFTLLPSIGLKLPIGNFDQENGNITLPIAVQASSGSFKYVLKVYMSKVLNEKMSIASTCSYEYSQLVDSKNFYYKYGDQWMLSFLAKYKLSKDISTYIQFRFENKDKAHEEFDQIIEFSGYKIIFITPQVTYNFKNNWQISTYANLPIYRYYNGIQLAAAYSLSFKLLKKLDFRF